VFSQTRSQQQGANTPFRLVDEEEGDEYQHRRHRIRHYPLVEEIEDELKMIMSTSTTPTMHEVPNVLHPHPHPHPPPAPPYLSEFMVATDQTTASSQHLDAKSRLILQDVTENRASYYSHHHYGHQAYHPEPLVDHFTADNYSQLMMSSGKVYQFPVLNTAGHTQVDGGASAPTEETHSPLPAISATTTRQPQASSPSSPTSARVGALKHPFSPPSALLLQSKRSYSDLTEESYDFDASTNNFTPAQLSKMNGNSQQQQEEEGGNSGGLLVNGQQQTENEHHVIMSKVAIPQLQQSTMINNQPDDQPPPSQQQQSSFSDNVSVNVLIQ